jgi:DNA-binding SARP family transcriptional activator/Flp pilus assembly protein TadD
MRFGVLGPLEVDAEAGPVALGGQKERLLLAQLLARPNQVVSAETLIRGLWGEQPPRSAAKTLQSHVVRLRRVLEPGRPRGAAGQILVTREPGYLLRVAPGTLDAARFEELCATARRALARGEAEVAASTLRAALGLWRGRAFEEFADTDFGAAEGDRLGELRLVAIEDRIEADLRLGRHRELVAELEGLVREHPLREGLWAALMLGLYRSGRQADALGAFQRARSTLVEELGIDPGADLRRLQAAILAQDPELELESAAQTALARRHPEALEPVERRILGIDIEGFSRPEWTDPIRARLRGRLHPLVDRALTDAQIPSSLTVRNDTGDGLWLVVQPEVSTARLLHPLASSLANGLADDNRCTPATERMRLRVVLHAGELLQDPHGHTGASFNYAARLLDADAIRAVLAGSPEAAVVLVVSDGVYEGVKRHAYEGIDPAGWQPIRIHHKGTATRAWVHLPGLATQPRLPAVLLAPRVGPASLPIPRELPRPAADFTGRRDERATLRTLLDLGRRDADGVDAPGTELGPVVISAIDGMGGIGKSALAIQVASQLADAGAFPDGQLYVNLHGATPGLVPLEPLDALGRLLRALGLDPAAIPGDSDEAAARFRSLAAERRLLVVLDNATSAEQVRPLLPASPTCRVLITSRQVLATLEGAHPLHLDVLPPEQAVALLGRIAGPQRIAAEPQAAAEVVQVCGRLPLAIRIAGARLAARPSWPLQALAERLTHASRRLEELRAGELAVQASFEVSLHALQESSDPTDRAAAQAFGLLGLPDGPDLDVTAAARLLHQPAPSTEAVLERLVDAQLLESPRPGRYQFHDLLRLYARQHAASRHPERERLAALLRLFGFYTATAWHTLALLHPGDQLTATADPRWTDGGLRFRNAADTRAWLETEWANLLAAVTQAAAAAPALPTELAGQLTRALYGLFDLGGYWHDGLQADHTVLRLAQRTDDAAASAYAHQHLGEIYFRLGRYAEAIASLQESLTFGRQVGDRWIQANSLDVLGAVYDRSGRYAEAITSLQESLALARELGDSYRQALSLHILSNPYSRLGRYAEAVANLQESLRLFRELGDRSREAASLNNLGMAYGGMRRYAEAIASLQECLMICREIGDRPHLAGSLDSLGMVYAQSRRYAEAVATLREALTLARELGEAHGQAVTLNNLGVAYHGLERYEEARVAWQEALAICEALQLPEATEIRGHLASLPTEAPQPVNHF